MPTRIQIRRDTTTRWTAVNPVLAIGEPAVDTVNGDLVVGNGSDRWTDLPRYAQFDVSHGSFNGPIMDALNSRYARTAMGTIVYAGDGALRSLQFPTTPNTSGSIIALGRNAMAAVTDSVDGIAIGNKAMSEGSATRDNIAIGGSALRVVEADSTQYDQSAKGGTRNIAIGGNAHYFLTKGWGCVAVGRNAGATLVAGNGLTAIGGGAAGGYAPIGLSGLIENWTPWGTTADVVNTTAVGNAAASLVQATDVVAIGGNALRNNKKSNFNTAVGSQALNALDSGTGYSGGVRTSLNLSATYVQAGTTLTVTATAHGLSAGDIVVLRLLDGPSQTFQQDQIPAVVASVTNSNVFVINSPLSINGSGNAQLYARETAAQAPTNTSNTAVGYVAGQNLQTGTNNTFMGSQAGKAATTSSGSTAIGMDALYNATSMSSSTALGFFAGGSMTGDATQVTAIGANALRTRVDGQPMVDAFTNVTGLGFDSRVSGSNQVQLGNSTSTTYVYGTVQNRSDVRDKADVRDTELGLEWLVGHPRPKDYRWDMRDDYVEHDENGDVVAVRERDGSRKRERFHHGVIAQEVEEYIERSGVDFGGFQDHARGGGSDVKTIGYDEYVAALIASVQDLHAIVVEQGKQIDTLTARLGEQ